MKKPSRLAAGLVCALMAALLILPASAHGCHGGRRQYSRPVQTAVTVCAYEDCDLAGRHVHDGVTYCGYAHGTGVCDGACLALCTVEGCDLTGRHTHDGVTYCGYAHSAGYCDGACVSGVSYGRGHCHGRGC